MDQATHNKIVSFIWGIADDVLRDLFKRGKYPDVILPMCVLRRLDAVLEPTKKAVLETKEMLDMAGITEQSAALCDAAKQAFFNTSKFTLRDLKSRASQQQLLADFTAYLDGFSPNVQDILENFKFRNQLPTLSKSDSLGTLIAKFLDPEINLSPDPVLNGDRSVKHPGMDNHSMGTIFAISVLTPSSTAIARSSIPAWTTIPWARYSRNSSASSTRRTTRKPANTGRPAMPSA